MLVTDSHIAVIFSDTKDFIITDPQTVFWNPNHRSLNVKSLMLKR